MVRRAGAGGDNSFAGEREENDKFFGLSERGKEMNDKFFELPEKKRLAIINGATEVFGKNDYKRASTDLIAAKAGVSKGLLFYYFHNKRELYLFLYRYAAEIMTKRIVNRRFLEITDFFELLRYGTEEKVKILRKNPYLLDFAVRAFYSRREDVSEELQRINMETEEMIYRKYFSHIDLYKFREDVEPVRIFKMLVWMADGYMHEQQMKGLRLDVDALMEEFEIWMEMLKKLAYREEYQKEA